MSDALPRLTYDELAPDLKQELAPKYERLGYLGEFFQFMGHQPDALLAFFRFTETAKSGLSKKLGQLIALTVSHHTNVLYEKNQHERLSVKLGFGRDWVAAVEEMDPDNAPLLEDDERAVQRFVLAALKDSGHGAQTELKNMVDVVGYEQAVAAMFVTGRYLAHGVMSNCIGLTPPVPSIFEDGFDG